MAREGWRLTVALLLTGDVRRLAGRWLQEWLPGAVLLGLPEWDDRLERWRRWDDLTA